MTGMEIIKRASADGQFRLAPTIDLTGLELESYSQTVQASKMEASFHFWVVDRWVSGDMGDWLVVHEGGSIEAVKDSAFRKRFNKVD